MHTLEGDFARYLGRLRCEHARCHFYQPETHGNADRLRQALRQAGVPALELNDAPLPVAESWLALASDISLEFLVPVVVFGGTEPQPNKQLPATPQEVDDPGWLAARQVALTRGLETSALNHEFRRSRDRSGWIHMGWCTETALREGNGLLLAWSSPLPLKRIRDFAARCPELVLSGPGIESLASEVAAQGISTAGWRFEVK